MRERAILSLRYTPAVGRAAGRAVAGFLRYVQYRDHHQDSEADRQLEGFARYLAHRDRTAPCGRLFTSNGRAGDVERSALLAYVKRSTASLRPNHSRHQPRAVYRLVLSPEHAEGLELQRLTRSVMAQLEHDVGDKLPPWIAAEHRNTKHPHVHIVLAAQREIEPGRFRQLVISKPRLARMKASLSIDLERQRDGRPRAGPLEKGQVLVRSADARPRRRRPRHESLRLGAELERSIRSALNAWAAYNRRQLYEAMRQLEREDEWER